MMSMRIAYHIHLIQGGHLESGGCQYQTIDHIIYLLEGLPGVKIPKSIFKKMSQSGQMVRRIIKTITITK